MNLKTLMHILFCGLKHHLIERLGSSVEAKPFFKLNSIHVALNIQIFHKLLKVHYNKISVLINDLHYISDLMFV